MLQDGGLPNTSRPLPLLRHLAALYTSPREVTAVAERLGIPDFDGTPIRRMSGGRSNGWPWPLPSSATPRPTNRPPGWTRTPALEVALIREEADRGAAVVVTTHSFEEAERLADAVVIMAAGRVVARHPGRSPRGAPRTSTSTWIDQWGYAVSAPAAAAADPFQARFETMTLLRNGEQLLVAVVLPAMALVGLTVSQSPSLGPGRRVDLAALGVLALAVVSTAPSPGRRSPPGSTAGMACSGISG